MRALRICMMKASVASTAAICLMLMFAQSAAAVWGQTDRCASAPNPDVCNENTWYGAPSASDLQWIKDHGWINLIRPDMGDTAGAVTWGKALMAIAPQLKTDFDSGNYAAGLSLLNTQAEVGLACTPLLWQLLGAKPLSADQMSKFYSTVFPYWASMVTCPNINTTYTTAQGVGTIFQGQIGNCLRPVDNNFYLDNNTHLTDAEAKNVSTAGDNQFPDIPRFIETDQLHTSTFDAVVSTVLKVAPAVIIGVATAGAGAAFEGALTTTSTATAAGGATVATTTLGGVTLSTTTTLATGAVATSTTLAGAAVTAGVDGVIGGTLTTAFNGGSLGQNILSSLEGAGIGTALAPISSGLSSGLTKAGVNSTVANYAASLATGTASGAIMNGGNFNQAFVGAATGAGIGALTNGLENYSNSQQSSYSAADARNAYVNGDSMNGLTVSNNFQSANLQPLSIAQLNQNVGAVDLSNIPMPVVNLPEVSASGSAYSLPADIQAMAGLTDLNQANLNSSLGLSAGLGGTSAAGALGLGYIQSTGTSSAAIGEVSIDVKPINSSYADINWTMPKPRDGIATIYDPNAGGMNSSIWYSIDSADNVVSTDYISIGKVVGDPARPGLGQYLLTAVAEQNPGMPIFGDIGLTNGQAFKSAFLQLATSDQPLTASAVSDALSQVPAIRSLPGTVEILPQFDSMGNLTKVGILRYPDLSSSSATVTNIDSLLGDTNFQNWISALPTQPVSYFNTNGSYALKTPIMSNANAGGGLSSGLRTAQGGFVDTSVFADGLDTLGNFARAAAPVALDGLNVGLTAWSAVDTLYPVAQAAIPQYQQNLNQLSTAVQNCSGIGCIGVNQSYDANSQALGNAMMIQMAGDYITHPAEAWIQGELQAFDNSTMQATNAENQAWANLAQSNSATNDLPTLPTVTITAPRPSTVSMIGANIANAVSTAYNTIASRVTSAFSSPAPAANAAVPAAISSTNRAPASMTQFRPAVSAMRPSTVGRIVSAPVARPTFVAPNLRRNNLYR